MDKKTRDHNVGESDYAKHTIQPWDIWLEYQLNPWDADIIKRVLRNKKGDSRSLDYQKIIHVCQERLRQLDKSSSEEGQYVKELKGNYRYSPKELLNNLMSMHYQSKNWGDI